MFVLVMERGAVARGAMRCVRPRPPLSAGRITRVNDEDILRFVVLGKSIEEQTVGGKRIVGGKSRVARLEQGMRRVSKRRSQARRSPSKTSLTQCMKEKYEDEKEIKESPCQL
jgi:hypothetical protein